MFGNTNGLAVVDYLQKTLLLNMGTSELYSPSDPYQRQPRSPRKTRQPSGGELHGDASLASSLPVCKHLRDACASQAPSEVDCPQPLRLRGGW